MIPATINGQAVDVEIIEADGRGGRGLDQTELNLIVAIDARLREHPDSVQSYPGARLIRIDSNRMLQDTEEGRFYLRYHHEGGDTEFWGHEATVPAVDFERGIVTMLPGAGSDG